MRRKDREVTDFDKIREILDGCKTCRLAMVDNGQPYVVPLNYAYELDDGALTLYFHSAKDGRKIRILRENGAVCFEISSEGEPIRAENDPCNSGYYYACVHGFGDARFIDEAGEKCAALTLLTKHQSGIDAEFTARQADGVCVFKVLSADYTCKVKPKD